VLDGEGRPTMTNHEESATWEASWEVQFPASSADELLLALVVRDLLHGASFDVEGDREGDNLALDYLTGDELDGDGYRLLVTVEACGGRDAEAVQEVTEQVLDQLVEEAESLVAEPRSLGSAAMDELEFRPVPEDEERWDLVLPDWLAPDGAEVPYGYRSFHRGPLEPWPTDAELDRHGRIVGVPFGGRLHLFAIPAPTDDAGIDPLSGDLPVVT
jgi:hypothetical protein